MDITTAISADRDWDGKTRYKSREIKESRNAKRETAEQKEIQYIEKSFSDRIQLLLADKIKEYL